MKHTLELCISYFSAWWVWRPAAQQNIRALQCGHQNKHTSVWDVLSHITSESELKRKYKSKDVLISSIVTHLNKLLNFICGHRTHTQILTWRGNKTVFSQKQRIPSTDKQAISLPSYFILVELVMGYLYAINGF